MWRLEDGGWRMENGEWRMENGEWRNRNYKILITNSSAGANIPADADIRLIR